MARTINSCDMCGALMTVIEGHDYDIGLKIVMACEECGHIQTFMHYCIPTEQEAEC